MKRKAEKILENCCNSLILDKGEKDFRSEEVSYPDVILYEQLANAFLDMMDGIQSWKEIRFITGLSDQRCKDIYTITSKLRNKE